MITAARRASVSGGGGAFTPSTASHGPALFLTGVDLMLSEEEKAIQESIMMHNAETPKLASNLGFGMGGRSSRASFLNANQTSWLEAAAKDIFPMAHIAKTAPTPAASETRRAARRVVPTVTSTPLIPADKAWAAHSDTIPAIVALASHGCFVTVSHDGYHRVWNLDAECLGTCAHTW